MLAAQRQDPCAGAAFDVDPAFARLLCGTLIPNRSAVVDTLLPTESHGDAALIQPGVAVEEQRSAHRGLGVGKGGRRPVTPPTLPALFPVSGDEVLGQDGRRQGGGCTTRPAGSWRSALCRPVALPPVPCSQPQSASLLQVGKAQNHISRP